MTPRAAITPIALVLAIAALAGACGTAPASHGDDRPHDPASLAEFLHETTSYDYEPVASPAALRERVDIAVVGEVAGVTSGKIRRETENTGIAIVALRVDEIWKSPGQTNDSLIYYMVHRPTNVDIAVYQDALPNGTRIALFGYRIPWTIVDGDPGVQVYEPAPQGLILETSPSTIVNVWADDAGGAWSGIHSLADLRRAIMQG